MGKDITELVSAVLVGAIGLAIIAVIVAPNAQTSSVIGAAGGSIGALIKSAVSPVTQQY
jgi:hypothetical protein